MGGASHFIFRSTSLLRWHLTLTAEGFRLKSEALKGRAEHSRDWDVRFDEVDVATLHQWASRKAAGETISFRTADRKTAMFSTTTNGVFGKDVTEEDRATYRGAAAAVFQAFAAAQPQAIVRKGRTPGSRIGIAIGLLIQTAILSGLYLWQTEGVSDGSRYSILTVILAMMTLYAIYRVKLFDRPVMVPVGDIARELSQRVPQTGPWGAVPAPA